MFWSPAVTTFSVVCANAAPAKASAEASAIRRDFIEPSYFVPAAILVADVARANGAPARTAAAVQSQLATIPQIVRRRHRRVRLRRRTHCARGGLVSPVLVRRKQQHRFAWNDDAGGGPFRQAVRRMDPHIAAGGAHAITIALADIHGLRNRPRENQAAIRRRRRSPQPGRIAAKMRAHAPLRSAAHRRDQYAVVALSDIYRVVRSQI